MIKLKKIIFCTSALLLAAACSSQVNDNVALAKKSKSKITCSLKKSTLTFKGKGPLLDKQYWKKYSESKRKKIKKIVIKKGITAIDDDALSHFYYLKELSIPKSVKYIGGYIHDSSCMEKVTMPGNVKYATHTYTDPNYEKTPFWSHNDGLVVNLTTNVDINAVDRINAATINLKKNDKKYCSVDGIIYSKDKKTLVRVPNSRYGRKSKILSGVTNMDLKAIAYASSNLDLDLPASLTKITKSVKKDYFLDHYVRFDENMKLDGVSLSLLYWGFRNSSDDTLRKLKAKNMVEEKDGFVYSKDGVLIAYTGESSEVTIPSNINTIGYGAFTIDYKVSDRIKKVNLHSGIKSIKDSAFYNCYNLEKIEIPDSVTEIGEYAFYGTVVYSFNLSNNLKTLGESAFASSDIQEITFPSNMTKIPKGVCDCCNKLEKVILPQGCKEIGNSAFSQCTKLDFDKSNLLVSSLEKIGDEAFYFTEWKDLVIGKNVKSIGRYAFAQSREKGEKTVLIKGSAKGFNHLAFQTGNKNLTLYYTNKKNNQTSLYRFGKLNRDYNSTKFAWNKVKGVSGYEIQISNNKKFKKNTKKGYFVYKYTSKKTKKNIIISKKKINKNIISVRIRTYIKKGKKKKYGKWSTPVNYRNYSEFKYLSYDK